MMEWTAKRVRETWVDFFKARGYHDVSNRSLILPPSDKSLLFINSGVAAIKSYFCGDINRPGDKLVSAQRVIRTGDIETIGESFRHHTYFEMLGNFCIGNASRKEAINLAWELLTSEYKLDPSRLYVTVFERDKEAYEIWKDIFKDEERIVKRGKDTNFWDMGVGPCGPCTEIYYDKGEEYDPEKIGLDLLRNDIENDRYLEIWNLVFSDFLNIDGQMKESPTKNLDTGAGLERLLAILQDKPNNFETTLFSPIIEFLRQETGIVEKSKLWAAADYFRTSLLLLREGVLFGNKGKEYVLRKIFRSAMTIIKGDKFKFDTLFFRRLSEVIWSSLNFYSKPETWEIANVVRNMSIESQLTEIVQGIFDKHLFALLEKYPEEVPAKELFHLVSSYGFSPGLLKEAIAQHNRNFSEEEYLKLEEEHREKSLNKNISAAFVKQAPDLLAEAQPTKFNYVDEAIKTKIIAAYTKDFKKIENLEEAILSSEIWIALEETVVFPESAGQKCDLGAIKANISTQPNQFFSFLRDRDSVKAPNGQILHPILVNDWWNEYLRSGVVVEVVMDRRRRISRSHTAEHILYSILKKSIHPEIIRYSGTKNEMGFYMEVQVPYSIKKEDFDLVAINEALDNAIKEDVEVKTYWGNLKEAKEKGIVGKFDAIYEKNQDSLRFVDIGKYGTELCIGTHVNKSSEIEDALISVFAKEQKNIYGFGLVVGSDSVNRFLRLGELSKSEFLYRFQNREKLEQERLQQEKEVFVKEKKELLEFLLNGEEFVEKVKLLERSIRLDVAMATFKDLRNYINDQVIILCSEEKEGLRFFAASSNIDLNNLFRKLRDAGCKCGGSPNFGSGMLYGENPKNLLIDCLKQEII